MFLLLGRLRSVHDLVPLAARGLPGSALHVSDCSSHRLETEGPILSGMFGRHGEIRLHVMTRPRVKGE